MLSFRHLPLVLAALLLVASPARAARWLTGPSLPSTMRAPGWHDATTLADAGRQLARAQAAALGLGGVELEPEQVLPDEGAGTVRLRQHHQGLPVHGGSVVVRLERGGAVHAVVVDVAPPLTASAVPAVSAAEARAVVGGLLGVEAPLDAEQAPATLGFERNDRRGGVLTWYVDAVAPAGPGGLPQARRHLVDARTGRLIGVQPLGRDASGRVYNINPVRTPAPTDEALDGLVAASPQHLNGFGGRVAIYNWVSGTLGSTRAPLKYEQVTAPNQGADFLFNPLKVNNTRLDPFAEVNIYYHFTRIRDFFTGALKVDMTAAKWTLLGLANYGPYSGYYDNAFFTPWNAAFGGWPGNARNAIFIGNGHSLNFAYDSDVFLHEFTHYVNHNALNFNRGGFDFDQFGVVTMPAAMDEGTADYFSCTVNDDPVLGEASLLGSARDLSQAGPSCPDGLSGESHADGQILATAAWAIREALGPVLADQLLWTSMTMFPDSPTFGDAASGILAAAASMKLEASQVQIIKDALAARGLDDCGRFLAVSAKPRTVSLFGLQLFAELLGTTCSGVRDTYGYSLTSPFQFEYTPAESDKAVTFHVTLKVQSGSGRLAWNLYSSAGTPVTFDQTATIDAAEYQVTGLTSTSADLVIDEHSTPPFDPTQTYYLAIGHTNCGSGTARITATNAAVVPDMAVPPDLTVHANGDGGALALPAASGCSCEVARGARPGSGNGGAVGLLVIAALGGVWVRRRRRRGE